MKTNADKLLFLGCVRLLLSLLWCFGSSPTQRIKERPFTLVLRRGVQVGAFGNEFKRRKLVEVGERALTPLSKKVRTQPQPLHQLGGVRTPQSCNVT